MFSENIGPCLLDFGGTELGETLGGVTFSFKESSVVTKTDKTGETSRAKYITGAECKVAGAITEATLAQIAKITGGTPSGTELLLKSRVGANLIDDAGVLILKPIVEGVASVTEADWIYVPKATVLPVFEVKHGLTEGDQKAWAFEFEGHPVTAADIASGGSLYGEGWVENDIARLGLDS